VTGDETRSCASQPSIIIVNTGVLWRSRPMPSLMENSEMLFPVEHVKLPVNRI
jgi:hypothetical protein